MGVLGWLGRKPDHLSPILGLTLEVDSKLFFLSNDLSMSALMPTFPHILNKNYLIKY